MMNNQSEVWKKVRIDPFQERYSVSNTGKIRSKYNGRILKPRTTVYGYKEVALYSKEKRVSILVHRLVAMHFCDNPENKAQVNHIDGNKTNNHFSNLEWTTQQENIAHATKNGLRFSAKGDFSPHHKLSEQDVTVIKTLIKTRMFKFKYIASLFNVNPTTISDINKGKTWSWLKIESNSTTPSKENNE